MDGAGIPLVEQPSWHGVDFSDAAAVLTRAFALYNPAIAIASSFSVEDATVIHIARSINPNARVFALDTGRLNPETYECAEALRERYGLAIEWFFPQRKDVEELLRTKGLFSFRESVLNRKECCYIRKVEPLDRALSGLKAWVTGLRQEQSVTRTALQAAEYDSGHPGLVKINPLASWSTNQLWNFVRENNIPYNKLHDQGFPSIGCAPCTRAIAPGEDFRAGRWWWESPEHKECGLHVNVEKNKGLGI